MGMLENAKPENCFYCADGSVLHNLLELRQKLKTITPQAFYHHVSQSKNDFHNWVRDVFQDYELANDILKAKTPAAAAATVDRHIRRALLAEEEIEQAIRKIIKARAKAIASAPAAKIKPKSSKDDWAQSTESRLGKPKRKLKPKKRRRLQKQLPQKVQKNKNTGKKRKLNKKSGNNKHHKGRKSSGGNSNYGNKNRIYGRSKKPKSLKSDWAQSPGRRLGRGKKRVNMWLKWLKLVPEL